MHSGAYLRDDVPHDAGRLHLVDTEIFDQSPHDRGGLVGTHASDRCCGSKGSSLGATCSRTRCSRMGSLARSSRVRWSSRVSRTGCGGDELLDEGWLNPLGGGSFQLRRLPHTEASARGREGHAGYYDHHRDQKHRGELRTRATRIISTPPSVRSQTTPVSHCREQSMRTWVAAITARATLCPPS